VGHYPLPFARTRERGAGWDAPDAGANGARAKLERVGVAKAKVVRRRAAESALVYREWIACQVDAATDLYPANCIAQKSARICERCRLTMDIVQK
jgi:hypothetical protein